jgi:anti-anti-sigma regulatory factor
MFNAERRSNTEPLQLSSVLAPEQLTVHIERLATSGEPRMNLSLGDIESLDFQTLQTLLAAREFCIQRGIVMRLTDVSEDMRARIQWADAGRLLEDDLMLV